MHVSPKKIVLGTLLIAAPLALWLILNDDNKLLSSAPVDRTSTTKSESINKKIAVQEDLNKTTKVIASTPLIHDQLVISPSLEGTEIDGFLKADAQGNLILDLAVRDFFDYFLSVSDEIGPENAISEIERYARSYLPERAGKQAIELLSNYLRYKRAEFELQQTPIAQSNLNDAKTLDLIEHSFTSLKVSRQGLFNDKQDKALFGLEDQFAEHTLATLRLMADETITEQQKGEQLAELEKQLPAELAANAQLTRGQKSQQADIERTLLVEIDDSQAFESLVDQGLTKQRASELIAARQENQQFERIYSDYSRAKSQLDANAVDYQQQLSALQKQFFISPEQQTKARLSDLRSDATQ